MTRNHNLLAQFQRRECGILSELPSPFLNGVFDELVRNNPNEKWIGLWETNRGCPFQCTL